MRLFENENRGTIILYPSTCEKIREVLDLAVSVGYPVWEETLDNPFDEEYPFLCVVVDSYGRTGKISQAGSAYVEYARKSSNEWVTELYKCKKDK